MFLITEGLSKDDFSKLLLIYILLFDKQCYLHIKDTMIKYFVLSKKKCWYILEHK